MIKKLDRAHNQSLVDQINALNGVKAGEPDSLELTIDHIKRDNSIKATIIQHGVYDSEELFHCKFETSADLSAMLTLIIYNIMINQRNISK